MKQNEHRMMSSAPKSVITPVPSPVKPAQIVTPNQGIDLFVKVGKSYLLVRLSRYHRSTVPIFTSVRNIINAGLNQTQITFIYLKWISIHIYFYHWA